MGYKRSGGPIAPSPSRASCRRAPRSISTTPRCSSRTPRRARCRSGRERSIFRPVPAVVPDRGRDGKRQDRGGADARQRLMAAGRARRPFTWPCPRWPRRTPCSTASATRGRRLFAPEPAPSVALVHGARDLHPRFSGRDAARRPRRRPLFRRGSGRRRIGYDRIDSLRGMDRRRPAARLPGRRRRGHGGPGVAGGPAEPAPVASSPRPDAPGARPRRGARLRRPIWGARSRPCSNSRRDWAGCAIVLSRDLADSRQREKLAAAFSRGLGEPGRGRQSTGARRHGLSVGPGHGGARRGARESAGANRPGAASFLCASCEPGRRRWTRSNERPARARLFFTSATPWTTHSRLGRR